MAVSKTKSPASKKKITDKKKTGAIKKAKAAKKKAEKTSKAMPKAITVKKKKRGTAEANKLKLYFTTRKRLYYMRKTKKLKMPWPVRELRKDIILIKVEDN